MTYPKWQRYLIAGMCAYEAVAIVTDNNRKCPTITYLQTKRHSLGIGLIACLGVHFIRADKA